MDGSVDQGLQTSARYRHVGRRRRILDVIVELSFGAIERSLEAYAIDVSRDSVDDFRDHAFAYERADALGLFEPETTERLEGLYGTNRTDSYYGGRRPTQEQADAMYALAEAIHEHVTNQLRNSGVCVC